MSFTTPCFIRKNTPELREKLRKLGHKVFPDIFNHPCLSAENGLVIPSDNYNRDGHYDCSENEDLFLAIASLQDDSDYMQWFWYKEKLFQCVGNGSTVTMDGLYSLKLKIENNGYIEVMSNHIRKATVPELVEHFKDTL